MNILFLLNKTQRRIIPILFLVAAFIVVSGCRNTQKRVFLFEGKYPPITEIPYNVNGKDYNISAYEGQCMLFFDENISHAQANALIRQYGGKIIEQMPAFNYYLVKVPSGKEADFVLRLRERNEVLYTFFNLPYISASQVYIFDNFKDMENTLLTSHGTAVKQIFTNYGMGSTIHCEHMFELSDTRTSEEDSLLMAGNNIVGKIFNIAQNTNADDIILINMSFGPKLNGKSKEWDLIKDVAPRYQEEYKIAYAESLKSLATSFTKVRKMGMSNFVVTKSSGNQGYHHLDSILNVLDESTVSSLTKNLVLVNAIDNKYQAISYENDSEKKYKTVWYTNLTSRKHDLCTTIDITDEKFSGTSFAAPKLLGYIDKLMMKYKTLNAQDILLAIRNATPENPREAMTYNMLEKEVKKLSGKQYNQYNYILDMTSEYSGEWNLTGEKGEDIVKYYVHDTYSVAYLNGQIPAIDIHNTTGNGIDIIFNAIDTERYIRSLRYHLASGEQQSFYIKNLDTADAISIPKLNISIKTW